MQPPSGIFIEARFSVRTRRVVEGSNLDDKTWALAIYLMNRSSAGVPPGSSARPTKLSPTHLQATASG